MDYGWCLVTVDSIHCWNWIEQIMSNIYSGILKGMDLENIQNMFWLIGEYSIDIQN